ncbi:F-box protein FBW2-like [Cornus florida]|uniref:F-box protein FBW2-like n=1 Tax=Cornus florida TaxID=4283 RepID=UPI00289D9B91|nr:F-box protein FBW2-like [Cornus florida]
MEERKWEDLNLDCLLNVYERLGVESLVLDIPFVCKSWYKATLSPQCWRHIKLPMLSCDFGSRLKYADRVEELGVRGIIKFAIKRSARSVVSLEMPGNLSCKSDKDLLVYIANECPVLKDLTLSTDLSASEMSIIPGLISKWKNLERDAWDVAALLPNLKYLDLSYAHLYDAHLDIILQGCKELLYLDVRYCVGFEEDDDEILKLASHIPTFLCEGSIRGDLSDDEEAYHVNKFWSRQKELYPPIYG